MQICFYSGSSGISVFQYCLHSYRKGYWNISKVEHVSMCNDARNRLIYESREHLLKWTAIYTRCFLSISDICWKYRILVACKIIVQSKDKKGIKSKVIKHNFC